MARASVPTIVSLDTFARLLAINPVHFNGAKADTCWPLLGGCSDIWPQHAWQSQGELVGREEVAQAIYDAETEIRQVIGYAVGPEWITQEAHEYPRYFRRDETAYGQDVRGLNKTIDANWGKIISPGQRAVTAISAGVTVSYSDADGDGWKELATVTASTSVTDANEVKIYTAGKLGVQEWEIRPVKTKAISGGTVTITADSWLFINPALWETYPTATDFSAIDIEATTNFVSTVDVYREYVDTTTTSAVFYWEDDAALTTQNGCFVIRDAELGIVAPLASTYDSATALWSTDSFTVCRDPDQVKLYYKAGNLSNRYLSSQSINPVDDYLAQAVVWLSVARMEYALCSCNNVRNVTQELRRDLTENTKDASYVRTNNMDIFTNPFGTRVGEVKAWQRVSKLLANNWKGATL